MRQLARGAHGACITLLLSAALAASAPACASRGGGERPRADPALITAQDLAKGHWTNAHSAITALRPRWLVNRGPDTIHGRMGDVQVLLDGVPIGRPAVLLQVNVSDVAYMRFVEPTAAAARWGPTYAHGVIFIATFPLAEQSSTP